MKYLISTYLTLIFFLLLILGVFSSLSAKEEVNKQSSIETEFVVVEKRINQLEEKVAELEEDIKELNGEIQKLEKVIRSLEIYTKPASSLPPDINVWEKINRGMGRKEVRDLLGYPEEILSHIHGGGEVWYYYRRGSITFNGNGVVIQRQNFKNFPPTRR